MSDEVSNENQEGQTLQETTGTKDTGEEGFQTTQASPDNTETADVQQNVERPDWLPQKFETPEQLAHSYKELEGKLHTRSEDFRNNIIEEMKSEADKDVPVPGDYKINVQAPEGMEFNVSEDDPMLGWFREKAHDLGLNQKEFDTFLNEFVVMDNTRGPDWNEEVKELGEHGERRLERVDTWASSSLSEEAYNKFANIRADAATVKLFEELMELNGQPKFNMTSQTEFQEQLNLDDLKAMQADPKYWKDKDPAFINKVQQGFAQYTRRKEKGAM